MYEGALIVSGIGIILYANLRFADLIKIPHQKIVGSEIKNYFAPDSLASLQAGLLQNNLLQHNIKLNLVASDRQLVPIQLSINNLISKDNGIYKFFVMTDLTEILLKEEELFLNRENLISINADLKNAKESAELALRVKSVWSAVVLMEAISLKCKPESITFY
jgi:hypothetical protein